MQGELVVLGVVAAYQNLKAVAGGIAQKVRRLLLFVPLLVVFQVPLIFQFHADLVQRGFTGGTFHLVEHRFQISDLFFTLCQQVYQHPGGGLLLFVVLKEVLGVLAGAESQIQRDGHLFALVVPVGHGQALHALLRQIEVGRQQLAVQAQLFAFAAGSKLLLPGSLLAQGTVVHIVHRLVQLLALGAQPLGAVLLGVVALQHRVEGRPLPDGVLLAVLLRTEEGILHRLAVRRGDAAGTAALRVQFLQLVNCRHQAALLGIGQLVGGQVFAVKGAPCGLPADHRPYTGHRLVQSICHRQFPLTGRCHDGRAAHQQKIRAGGLGGRGVGQTRQQLPDVAVLKIHPLEGIDDFSTLHQHKVGVAPHQLGAQGIAHKVAHLVGALKIKVDDAVARLHVHVQQSAAGQVLAHEHTEGGRRLGVFKGLLGQTHPCRAAAGRQQQRVGIGAGAQGDDQLIPGRFKNFCDLGIGQGGFQFRRRQRQCRGIQCHSVYLVLSITLSVACGVASFSFYAERPPPFGGGGIAQQ